MARVMYLDCFSGAAGDMLLAAFVDAGLPVDQLRRALGTLGLAHDLHITRTTRAGIAATHVDVVDRNPPGPVNHPPGHSHSHADDTAPAEGRPHGSAHGHRSLADIAALVERSGLSPTGKARAVSLFGRLGEAEAAIHGVSIDQVHLHEVGALDSIIDVVGSVFALEWFGIDDIVASPVYVGAGTVRMAHGVFPVPAPATLRLLSGVPVYSSGIQAELLTPTGALLVSSYARQYGPLPSMTVERVGYGAGTRHLDPVPNVLRVVIGDRLDRAAATTDDGPVVRIECEIDDMNPQLFGPAGERLLEAGALDVFLTPIVMKKGRPGVLLTVLSPADRRESICDLIFRETTTLGVRFDRVNRETLDRTWIDVDVAGGRVRIKVGSRGRDVLSAAPEFEDCLRVATATGQPLKAIQAAALAAWVRRRDDES